MLRALFAAVRRFLSRRAARKLLAQHPLRGLRVVLLAVPRVRLPMRLRLRAPMDSRVRELGIADVRAFRLDPDTLAPANAGIVPAGPADPSYRWVRPAFRRRYLDLPWMARERVGFLGPMHAEWFAIWRDAHLAERLGPAEPREWERPEEVDWAMDTCKEQMLIRRDVVKDEAAPTEQEWSAPEIGHPLVAWDRSANRPPCRGHSSFPSRSSRHRSSWLTVSCLRIAIARRILFAIAGSSIGTLFSRVGLGGGRSSVRLPRGCIPAGVTPWIS